MAGLSKRRVEIDDARRAQRAFFWIACISGDLGSFLQ
jgi:hypothetical protein